MFAALLLAGFVAALFFLVSFVFGAAWWALTPGATLIPVFNTALLWAAMAFVIALILMWRDRSHHLAAYESVQKMLLARDDLEDAAFLAPYSDLDPKLLLEIRQAIAGMFEVPPTKIYPTDNPNVDLQFTAMEPAPHLVVVTEIVRMHELNPKMLRANPAKFNDLRTLCEEMQKVLEECRTESNGAAG